MIVDKDAFGTSLGLPGLGLLFELTQRDLAKWLDPAQRPLGTAGKRALQTDLQAESLL